MDQYQKITEELTDFIAASPSCYHVIANARRLLVANGFTELFENSYWKLEPGHGYFTVRADSSVIAFRIPEGEPENFQMIASHSDSPSFKIKENEEICRDGAYVELNVEKYGGMLCAPWFDRPLSIAGRAVVEEDGVLRTKLVNFDRDLVMLPSLAIHMNRQANENASYKIQSDMLPIFGDGEAKGTFGSMLASELGTQPEHILGKDLFLYARSRAAFWGAKGEFFSSPKLDDLQCAFSSLTAFLRTADSARTAEPAQASADPQDRNPAEMQIPVGTKNEKSVTMCCIFDNEEVGSQTKQGANSTFLAEVIERICSCLGYTREKQMMMISDGFLLSADNAHAVHPNNLSKADPTNHPHMNQGVVLKYNANQKYTTDAVSGAIFTAICRRNEIPVQTFVNHSDVPGGSTLGNIANTHVSLNTVDIGAPQLAMHSPYETGGIRDTWYLEQAMEAFYRTHIHRNAEGSYILE